MSFIADSEKDWVSFDYILGNEPGGLSIATDRYYYLYELNSKSPLKVAFRDPSNDYWTKWGEFPGLLIEQERNDYGITFSRISAAIDVHRSILPNEIVIESDYPTYEENYEAAKIIGEIIESKGFKPMYYYSGNKSVHIHVFFDWKCLDNLDPILQSQLGTLFNKSMLRFKRKFMEWLRTKMISCWDTNLKKFDEDLIKANHLIRCELSKNKKGYKTFLGYTHKDMSFIPYVCNEENRIYPKLGEIRLSFLEKTGPLIEEFIEDLDKNKKAKIIKKRNHTLANWGVQNHPEKMRECVKLILSEDFKKYGDGFKRGMFILLNELRRVMGESEARIVINDWNSRMDFPVKESEIEYRFKKKNYSLTCEYIHKFLKELGIDVLQKCKGKVYN